MALRYFARNVPLCVHHLSTQLHERYEIFQTFLLRTCILQDWSGEGLLPEAYLFKLLLALEFQMKLL